MSKTTFEYLVSPRLEIQGRGFQKENTRKNLGLL